MPEVKTLDLIVQAKRINPETQELETVERAVSVPEQAIINQLTNKFPALLNVDSVTIIAAAWTIETTE